MPVHFDEDAQKRRSAEFRLQEAERFAGLVAHNSGLHYVDLSLVSINPDALGLVEETEARGAKLAVFREIGKKIDVAVFSPSFSGVSEILGKLKAQGCTPNIFVTTEESLKQAWKFYADIQKIEQTKVGQIDISAESINKYASRVKTLEDTKTLVCSIFWMSA